MYSNVTDIIIKILPIVIAIFALWYSRKAIKHSEKVSKPQIFGRKYDEGFYSFNIKDYSVGRNLRIDDILLKPINNWKYSKLKTRMSPWSDTTVN